MWICGNPEQNSRQTHRARKSFFGKEEGRLMTDQRHVQAKTLRLIAENSPNRLMGNKMEDKVPIGEFSGQSLQFCAVIEIFCSFVGGNLSGKSSAMIAEGKRTNFILNFRGFTIENLVHETITCHQVKVLVFHNLFYYFRGKNKVFPFLSDNVWRPIKYI